MVSDVRSCLYMRLSADDETEGESNSIANQRKQLREYLYHLPGLCGGEITEIVDDGYSGTNFERPGVTRLLKMTQCGQIGCILVKDFSRFCRNYIALGDYLERIFPASGIRFISVNDHYDSLTADSLRSGQEIAFTGFIYDWYSKDTSIKVSAVKRRQMEAGLYLGPYAPYGFRKSEEQRGRLEPLEETAAVVRRMYEWAAQGFSDRQIAVRLNEEKILTPRRFMQTQGIGMGFRNVEKGLWDKSEVRRILKDVRNIGDMPVSKSRRIAVGNRKFVHKPEQEWLVITGTHTPLVDPSLFDRAMQHRRVRAHSCSVQSGSRVRHILCGRLRCVVCGRQLQRSMHRGGRIDYRCPRSALTMQSGCPIQRIAEKDILYALRQIINVLLSESFTGCMGLNRDAEVETALYGVAKRQAAGCEKETLAALYEEYRMGRISRGQFAARKEGRISVDEMETNEAVSRVGDFVQKETEEEVYHRQIIALLDHVIYHGEKRIDIVLSMRKPF